MKIIVFIDTWQPQVNGVVTVYQNITRELTKRNHLIKVVHPFLFKTFPMPLYPEIRLSYNHFRKVGEVVREFKPDAIHIATEGPIGLTARNYCGRNKIPYTTSYHSKYPEYVNLRLKFIPLRFLYHFIFKFHQNSQCILVPSENFARELLEKKFKRIKVWKSGYDKATFNPKNQVRTLFKKPIFLYVGRIAVEKNITSFLSLALPGTKVVVGDGPQRSDYEKKYPDAVFLGYKRGKELAGYYAAADVLVFPSKTDTLGLVMLESIACGTPVAAFNVTGPKGVIENGVNGFLGDDLKENCLKALTLASGKVLRTARKWSWENSAQVFLDSLSRVEGNKLGGNK